MFNELRGRIDELHENLHEEIVSIKKGHGNHRKNLSEMKNILERTNSRLVVICCKEITINWWF